VGGGGPAVGRWFAVGDPARPPPSTE
jgi:hypothetical protein